jgi:hypothetical protein
MDSVVCNIISMDRIHLILSDSVFESSSHIMDWNLV